MVVLTDSKSIEKRGAVAAHSDAHSLAKASESGGAQPQSVLPVDPGFTVEAGVAQRFVKGEDIAFCYRADPALLGRAMPATQPTDPADWKLNYDVFVVCDGHSGSAVRPCSSWSAAVCRNTRDQLGKRQPPSRPRSRSGAAAPGFIPLGVKVFDGFSRPLRCRSARRSAR